MTRTLLKAAYYRIFPPTLPGDVRFSLGYVFHTEAIHDERIFAQLLAFLREYTALTGKRAICTIMTPENPRIRAGMSQTGCNQRVFVERVHRIAELASLGYHGHFFVSREDFALPEAEIRCNNFVASSVREQMDAELAWFDRQGFARPIYYSAGWWFMNAFVQRLLIEHGFEYDFSISKSPWFRNQYSHRLLQEHSLATGQPFRIVSSTGASLVCVQNLIGCHTTPFYGDYFRNVRRLLTPGWADCLAVHHSHDYDLDPPNTLECLRALQRRDSVEFFGAEDLPGLIAARRIPELRLEQIEPRAAWPLRKPSGATA